MQSISQYSARSPRLVMASVGLFSLVLLLLVALPSFMPESFPWLSGVKVDTDPENMLPADEPVRVFHNDMKKQFALYDMVVVGVTDPGNPNGVFNKDTLTNIYQLAEYAKSIRWQDENGKEQGVIGVELLAPSNVDNIEQAGLGQVRFEWLMKEPPASEAEALSIRDKALNLPMLKGTLVAESGDALALYVPLTQKSVSFQVAEKLREKVNSFSNKKENYYITGLPVAQDTFGVEMFIQMAVSAPFAMLLIFLLMLVFFKKFTLILSPLLIAMVSVIVSMGLLIITGNTVHIMSSMIPIFIMPIAVLDAVHILSEFFDRYQETKDRMKTIDFVMKDLSAPMLYTSLTTCAGFASLAFTPIPPVQIFGIFVAIGVFFAWLYTITMVPAYIALMSEESLAKFGAAHSEDEEHSTLLGRLLAPLGSVTFNHAKLILTGVLVLAVVAVYGISKVQINDNPVKWFTESHEIRVADKELNKRFAGTYMAYLALQSGEDELNLAASAKKLESELRANHSKPYDAVADLVSTVASQSKDVAGFVESLRDEAQKLQDAAPDDEWDSFDQAINLVDSVLQWGEVFKEPDTLRYIEKFQDYLISTGLVGKSNSLSDVVKTVHRELLLGEAKEFRIPDSMPAVGQTLVTYQSSHRPNDLWHFVTPDYRSSNIWVQLKSGDNKDMSSVVAAVNDYFAKNPPPHNLKHQWFGLTYINVVWQQKMVAGMLEAFLGSFIIVLILMTVLFRSLSWGLLAMVPLTFTIAMIYGIIGLIGKDYDMPVAVLSSLSLGLAVDYAIHFLARSRELRKKYSSWRETCQAMFGEPARAITRNIIVVGVGFLPLLAAPLVPYKTVGAFISAILIFAGVATLSILPAMIKLFESYLFKNTKSKTLSSNKEAA